MVPFDLIEIYAVVFDRKLSAGIARGSSGDSINIYKNDENIIFYYYDFKQSIKQLASNKASKQH